MPKEYPGRIHGDGHLIVNESFYKPLTREEISQYFAILVSIMCKARIQIAIHTHDPEVQKTLLALKQRFIIGFSNGCPWIEKAIIENLLEQKTPPTTLRKLRNKIVKSEYFDGKHSFLFQNLVEVASEPLKKKLLGYHLWKKIDKQEDRNLPKEMTELKGKGAYGLAHDPLYFGVLIPLYEFIDLGENLESRQARYVKVLEFFEGVGSKVTSITALKRETKMFLLHTQSKV